VRLIAKAPLAEVDHLLQTLFRQFELPTVQVPLKDLLQLDQLVDRFSPHAAQQQERGHEHSQNDEPQLLPTGILTGDNINSIHTRIS
jgi:hypothetical protein